MAVTVAEVDRGEVEEAAEGLSTPLLVALGAWALAAPLAGWAALRQQ